LGTLAIGVSRKGIGWVSGQRLYRGVVRVQRG